MQQSAIIAVQGQFRIIRRQLDIYWRYMSEIHCEEEEQQKCSCSGRDSKANVFLSASLLCRGGEYKLPYHYCRSFKAVTENC